MSDADVFKKAQDAVDHSNAIFEATANMMIEDGKSMEDAVAHMMFVGAAILAAILVNRQTEEDEKGIDHFAKLIRSFAKQTRAATTEMN